MVFGFLYLYDMKPIILLLFLCLIGCQKQQPEKKTIQKATTDKQETYSLKIPNSKYLLKAFTNSNYQMNVVDSFLLQNYRDLSGKVNILKDPEFDNKECGYTRNFQFGISYQIKQCGEASGVYEWIILPKTELAMVKEFVEALAISTPTYEPFEWYDGKINHYGPKSKEAGCYYWIEETETNTKIRIECGC